jgi:hypothetical protein
VLNVPYRIFFTTRTEFSQWVKARNGYEPVDDRESWDSPEYEEWIKHEPNKPSKLLKISTNIFDGKGNLVIYTAQQWHDDWISLAEYQPSLGEPIDNPEFITDDDIPL